jgi:integral membrane protein
MSVPDFYKLLDVAREASREEIVNAAKRKNAELKKALSILTDPEKRKAYDAKLGQPLIKLPLPLITYKPALANSLLPFFIVLISALCVMMLEDAFVRQVCMGVAAISGIWLLLTLLSRAEMELGDEQLNLKTPWGKRYEWPLHKIRTLDIEQNVWQKLINIGTVRIDTQDEECFYFSGMGAPLNFLAHYQAIREKFDSAMWTGRINIPRKKQEKTASLAEKQREMLLKVRYLGMAEGSSLLLLLFIAMPLKYYMGIPAAVYWIGSLHGILFTLYFIYLIIGKFTIPLPIKFMLLGILAAFLPFGTFFLDRKLKNIA